MRFVIKALDLFYTPCVFNSFLVRLPTRHIGRLLSLTFFDDDTQSGRTLLFIIGTPLKTDW